MRNIDVYFDRINRCYEANRIISSIAAHGRRFFWNETNKRTAYFLVNRRSGLWFYDEYCEKPQYMHVPKSRQWKNFSGGGTMQRLVTALKTYIMTGEPVSPGHFGPWSKSLCDGDLWGYGFDEMEKVREKVLETDAVVKYAG